MNAKQEILKNIQNGTFALMNAEQIAALLHLGRREMLAIRAMLASLVRSGELLTDSRGRFGTAAQFGAKTGKIAGSDRGFAFFLPDDGSGDLFLPHRALKGALHGDCVLACPAARKSAGDEGEVLAILSRGMREIVGVYQSERRAGYLHPDEKRYAADVLIPAGKQGACRNGMKAVARITSFDGGMPVGEIIEILGACNDLATEERAVIRAHALREQFPEEVREEAKRQARRDIRSELKGREDLRGELIITVDGEDTRDIDDAISVSREGGLFHLGVHIADVSHYVARNLVLDREAYKRGTSVYFPDRVLPMLPTELSNGICSLNEGEDRLTLSCFMTVDGRGKVLKKRVAPTVIRSRHRMTYTEVAAIFEGEEEAVKAYPDLVCFVQTAAELMEILKNARSRRGGVALDIKEAKILYRDGTITVPDHRRTVAHEMIEQFMVLANESVAELMTARKVPFIYRVHERPSEEKASDFAAFLRELGVRADFDPSKVSPQDYRNLLAALEGSALSPIVSRVMLRSMMKAAYSPENIGHFGLTSECYCHFTSPIRRYPDLCVHRIVKETLRDAETAKERYAGSVEGAARQASLCERNAQEAERDVDALFIAAYMQDKIGEEYEATVSGVTAFGLFAELPNTIEGFIPLETLPEDGYEWIEQRMLLKGARHCFRLGDGVRVRVAGVDWGSRRVQFTLMPPESARKRPVERKR